MQVYLKADVKRGAATNFARENLATVASLLATPHCAPAYQPGSSAGNGGCIVLLVNVEVCSDFFVTWRMNCIFKELGCKASD